VPGCAGSKESWLMRVAPFGLAVGAAKNMALPRVGGCWQMLC
jgi:hypothetical protein